MIIGAWERKERGPLTRPEPATYICVAFGLLPGILLVPAGALAKGNAGFTSLLFLGALLAGPATGLLCGGILDSAYEAILRRRRGEVSTSVRPRFAPGVLFGGLVGLLAGALVGGVSCCLAGIVEFLWNGILAGMLAGPAIGMIIGAWERKARGPMTRPDTATYICVAFGLLPGLLLAPVAALAGGGNTKLTGLLYLGALFAGPAVGLVFGAMLDRAYEASLRGSRGEALRSTAAALILGTAVLGGLVYIVSPADPKVVADAARTAILWRWSQKPETRDAAIRDISLVYEGRNQYKGLAHATIHGRKARFTVLVVYVDEIEQLSVEESR
jgi:hypothetical protein